MTVGSCSGARGRGPGDGGASVTSADGRPGVGQFDRRDVRRARLAAAGGPGRAEEVEVQVIGAGGALAGSARGARGGGEDGGRGDRGGTAAVLSWASAVRAVCRQIASFFPRRRNRVSSIATATGVPAGGVVDRDGHRRPSWGQQRDHPGGRQPSPGHRDSTGRGRRSGVPGHAAASAAVAPRPASRTPCACPPPCPGGQGDKSPVNREVHAGICGSPRLRPGHPTVFRRSCHRTLPPTGRTAARCVAACIMPASPWIFCMRSRDEMSLNPSWRKMKFETAQGD